jgi:hypothetical protein
VRIQVFSRVLIIYQDQETLFLPRNTELTKKVGHGAGRPTLNGSFLAMVRHNQQRWSWSVNDIVCAILIQEMIVRWRKSEIRSRGKICFVRESDDILK